jgi:hypothetical protein
VVPPAVGASPEDLGLIATIFAIGVDRKAPIVDNANAVAIAIIRGLMAGGHRRSKPSPEGYQNMSANHPSNHAALMKRCTWRWGID